MVFSINKQAVEIKTRFKHAPLTSKFEVMATIGMLSKIYNLPVPEKKDDLFKMRADLHAMIDKLKAPSEYAEKLISLLDAYDKPADVTEEMYDLLMYSYEDQI